MVWLKWQLKMLDLGISMQATLPFAAANIFDDLDGETATICIALVKIGQYEKKNMVFFIDSKVEVTTLALTNLCAWRKH
ncbi:hypothetical protein TNCT_666171 [Trichonephila clavata]|uniref:Uncharacterized protein n=1 Tax=Trichonephila clavata TaxID=2740835 RepID=A0A8X6LL81_TRICU|nr:hypothetical protein TNCT_666171 [Trichonephila clavata]